MGGRSPVGAQRSGVVLRERCQRTGGGPGEHRPRICGGNARVMFSVAGYQRNPADAIYDVNPDDERFVMFRMGDEDGASAEAYLVVSCSRSFASGWELVSDSIARQIPGSRLQGRSRDCRLSDWSEPKIMTTQLKNTRPEGSPSGLGRGSLAVVDRRCLVAVCVQQSRGFGRG